MTRMTVLNIACVGALVETAKVLIVAGANVNAVDDHGRTPLLEAAEQPIRYIKHDQPEPEHPREEDIQAYRKIVRLLFDAGADPYRVNTDGLTAEMFTKDPIVRSILQRPMK